MADRALRGMGLGAKSFEDEEGIDFAARQEIGFDCTNGHHFQIAFSVEADLPSQWECPRCGDLASRSDGSKPENKEEKPKRTHWDMLLERRSLEELEAVFKERLADVRKSETIY